MNTWRRALAVVVPALVLVSRSGRLPLAVAAPAAAQPINGYEHRYSLAVGQVDGSDVQRLPATSGSLVWTLEPHWSPDGTSIVYVVTTAPDGAHLYHVRPNATGNTVITAGWQPAW